jgi:hypothetical protein
MMVLTCASDQTSSFSALYAAKVEFNAPPERPVSNVTTVHGRYCTPFGSVRLFNPAGADPAGLSNAKAVVFNPNGAQKLLSSNFHTMEWYSGEMTALTARRNRALSESPVLVRIVGYEAGRIFGVTMQVTLRRRASFCMPKLTRY